MHRGNDDTIYALATPPGRGAVAIVRLSGPGCRGVLKRFTGHDDVTPREMAFRRVRHPESGEVLDQALVAFFEGPDSVTGEDVVEFHTHGSPAVVRALMGALAQERGTRPADAGEFSRRGFMNDKLSLVELEGLADLMAAETESQRRCALRQMDGGLREACDRWRGEVIRAMAEVEAVIDFGEDEEDVLRFEVSQLSGRVEALCEDIRDVLADSERVDLVRDGVHIPIIGPPNAGKSSLLNCLAKREVAIVSEVPGTTRDAIEVHLNIAGYSVMLVDTAGLRHTEDTIEKFGIERAQQRLLSADMCIWVFDVSSLEADLRSSSEFVAGVFREHVSQHPHQKQLVVLNKSDLDQEADPQRLLDLVTRVLPVDPLHISQISCARGQGIDHFLTVLRQHIQAIFDGFNPQSALIYRERQRHLLGLCLQHLDAFLDLEPSTHPRCIELAAEELRQAAFALGRITGKIHIEEILDALFAEFCIGK